MDGKFAVLIPARLESTRLPRKLLLEAGGKTILQWTWEAATTSQASYVAIVTGDDEIAQVARGFGASVLRSGQEHDSGTSRIAEVVDRVPYDANIVINLQGDEPTVQPEWLNLLAAHLTNRPDLDIATLTCPLADGDKHNLSCVKAAVGDQGRILWFGRQPVGDRQHIGIYAFWRGCLRDLPSPTTLARVESLEQLSWLEHAYHIGSLEVGEAPVNVNTAEDLEHFRLLVNA